MARREYLMRMRKRIKIEGLIESKLCGCSCNSFDSQEVVIFITTINKINYRTAITFENFEKHRDTSISNMIVKEIRKQEIEVNGRVK